MGNFDFISSDGSTLIEAFHWPCENPKGVVQLCHGMAEHMGRYREFVEFLNAHGYAVVGNNHIGHGKSLIDGTYGYFGDDGAYMTVVDDLEVLRKKAREVYPDLPYFLFGHSMGSFIARLYINRYRDVLSGVIISGTAGPNPNAAASIEMAEAACQQYGRRTVGQMPGRRASSDGSKPSADWLSRDEARNKDYMDDPLCGFPFTTSGYKELFRMIADISADEWFDNVPIDLPTLIISGAEDSVGGNGVGVRAVNEKLIQHGMKSLRCIIYEGGRHEMLNEINRIEVYGDILTFLNENI